MNIKNILSYVIPSMARKAGYEKGYREGQRYLHSALNSIVTTQNYDVQNLQVVKVLRDNLSEDNVKTIISTQMGSMIAKDIKEKMSQCTTPHHIENCLNHCCKVRYVIIKPEEYNG